ncbi:hypothetical protein BV394_02000 [Brevirhabdus pacifica]|uniref:Uncharacterized protein n=1 Tax=Brevirhabdus pacifica TaxID=1267768 RepID=A0A1U7DF80_9RHOB|nr:hypothetical protein BV394_02000 [Brevirhabdus pacifica]
MPDHVGGGFAGASGNLAPAQAALEKMGAGRPEEVDGGDYEVIWLLGDGTVRNYEGGGWFSLEAPFQAIGSGAEIALGALHVGADAETAVRAACALHTGCGGTADIERVCCVVE